MQEQEPLSDLQAVDAILSTNGYDALVATAPENVTYVSGFWAMTHWIRRGPQAYVLWPTARRSEASIITTTSTLDLVADQKPWVSNVRRFGYFVFEGMDRTGLDPLDQAQVDLLMGEEFPGAVEALVEAIREAGLSSGKIAVDEIGMTPQAMARLREALPHLTIEPAFELIRQMRTIKTPEEVRRLRRACNIAEASINASLEAAHVGMTEREMARIFHRTTVENDAMPVLGVIGFGVRSTLTNSQPSDAALKEGDIIRFDVGGRYMHYRADISRIGVMGEPTREIVEKYTALKNGVDHAYDIIRPGLKASDLFEKVMDAVRKSGLPEYKRNHVGHGIGIDGYDLPNIAPSSSDVLQAGMVICVETPYYEFGLGGLQVEDMIHVTDDGCESLMEFDRELRIVSA
ncbi:Xaa-Pro peptidase family protein [Hoeflea sp. CAU 1731]